MTITVCFIFVQKLHYVIPAYYELPAIVNDVHMKVQIVSAEREAKAEDKKQRDTGCQLYCMLCTVHICGSHF